jgi:hypothetical protein
MIDIKTAAFVVLALAAPVSPAAAQQNQGPPHGMMGQGWTMGQGTMQGPGTMMQTPMMPCTGPGAMMGWGPMMGGPGQHIEGRIAFLKTEIGITPAQEPVWKTYADALRTSASSMQAMHDQMMSGGMPATLPERMQWHEQLMSSRLDALKALRAAAGPLYNALSPAQKEIADNLMGMM